MKTRISRRQAIAIPVAGISLAAVGQPAAQAAPAEGAIVTIYLDGATAKTLLTALALALSNPADQK